MGIEQDKVMVSVFCLAYNHEKYIRDALEGFVNQNTNFKYEVYVHDDASSDNTAGIIREYEKKYPDIIHGIYQKENQHSKGISITNTFIKPHMRGKYIAMCEGDDYWCDSNKLQKQVDILENNPSYSACVHQTIKLNCKTGEKSRFSCYTCDRFVDLNDICINWIFHTSSIVCKTELVTERPEFCFFIKGMGDLPLSIYLFLNGKIYYINDEMSVYRYLSSDLAWTSKVNRLSFESIIEFKNKKITMLEMADKYSSYLYHDDFNKGIKNLEYQIYNLDYLQKVKNHEKGIIGNKKYKVFIEKENFKTKLWIGLRPYLSQSVVNFLKKFNSSLD